MDALTRQRRFNRRAIRAVALALVLVLAATSVGALTWHQHTDASGATTCQVCHFAHLRLVAPHVQARLLRPRLLYRVALRNSVWTYAGPAAFSISPRAPPL
ncbi:MAG TPA: hypothetical protein VJO16_00520 [Candidatus Acidoferrum sp.]|nr:hypothetical protein [Candidatus Acidoferrum sp.]